MNMVFLNFSGPVSSSRNYTMPANKCNYKAFFQSTSSLISQAIN